MAGLGKPITVEERIIQIVADILGLRREQVGRESVLTELGADPYDLVEIELEIEEYCGVSIDARRLRRAKKVGDLIQLVEAQIGPLTTKE